MRVVVALGGNALLRRGQVLSAENQRENARAACAALAPLALEHELVLSHGNGPQVGLLALQGSAYTAVDTYPLDVLGAQTEGMIGYMLEQELGNELPFERHLATLLTMIEVDAADPAFQRPTKPIGPLYDADEAARLEREKGWTFMADGDSLRRAVPSPAPKRIFGIHVIRTLLEQGVVVICAGGGGIPTTYTDEPAPAGRRLGGVEAVIDKDLASALLAIEIGADALLIVTDVDAVYADWGTPEQRADPQRDARAARRLGVRRGLDGTEGARRVLVRGADRRLRRHRLDRRHPGAAAGRGRHPRLRRDRRSHGLRGPHGHHRIRTDGDTGDHRSPHVARPPREDALRELGVEPEAGLSSGEADERRTRYGPNKFAEAKAEPRWQAFLRQYRDPMQIVLLAAGVISIYPVKQPGTGIMILLLTLLNALLGLNQEGKAAAAVAALAKMMIVKARVRRDGALAQLPAEELVPGDIVDIEAGDLVPADGRLLSAATLEVAEAALTGESLPVGKGVDARRGARRAARRPHGHGLHEHERDARDRLLRGHGDGHGDRGRSHLRDAAAPGRVEVAADAPAGEADQAARDDRRARAGHLDRAQHGPRPVVHRGLHRGRGVRHRRDPDRAPGRRDDDPVPGHAAARRRERDRQAAALDRDARRDLGDLLRQDRHADAQPDDRGRADDPRAPLQDLRHRLLDGGDRSSTWPASRTCRWSSSCSRSRWPATRCSPRPAR